MLNTEALKELKDALSEKQFSLDPDDLLNYGRDWTRYFDIKPSLIVFPEKTEQVKAVVDWANRHKVALVPSGGRTGLSGGACALNGEVVVSFERMRRILGFEEIESVVHVEAGLVTEELQKFALSQNLIYPVDFAARGSSQIGGNIATNAGGIKVIRYGMTRNWVVGLRVVTGAGDVLNLNGGLIKNATGYDFKDLFIGSEGTLGFITEAMIKLAPQENKNLAKKQVLLLAVENMNLIMQVFANLKREFLLEAFEFFDQGALKRVLKEKSWASPFAEEYPFYLVVECEIAKDETGDELVLNAFSYLLENELVKDGLLAQSEDQARQFWRYREDISECLSPYTPYKNDIAVRISQVPHLLLNLEKLIKQAYPNWTVVWFGHIGDGNLHINIIKPDELSKEDFIQACQKVDALIFSEVEKLEGAISAEHGVGLTKKPFLKHSRSKMEIELMKQVKKAFDPNGIMNPGKIFD